MSATELPFIDLKKQYAELKTEIQDRINRVLEHGQYIMGPEVAELERALETWSGARHCVTVSSGTEALLIALMTLDIKPGDEVITSPFTFAATAETIVLAGARPVFVDIDPRTCNIDPTAIERVITPRTRAIIPVSLYGQAADMDPINEIAARHGLRVIEDAAQSFGAEYKGRKSGNLSTFGCLSFFPSKPLGCYGDGGAILTNDDALAEACRQIRIHGQSKRYVHTRIGVGGRMDTLQCAVVLAKMNRFDWEIARRVEAGHVYNRLLDQAGIRRVTQMPGHLSVHAQYTVRVANREMVADRLKTNGIPTAIHYPLPLNRQPAYEALSLGGPTPEADAASREVMSLPMHPYLDVATQQRIVGALVDAMRA
ncbi:MULTISPECIES: DegT/DnrJ/EryC1/StrS family aminotransferase [Rhizobium/Agrobacterium group]|uniref:DegT/DnrJ/EryC1/StrS family aminotransferase n=1 Tax=Rhizobium oryzihabitans TaxID=2267833 RepID=UPI004033A55E